MNEERGTAITNRGAILRLVLLLGATLVAGTASAQVPGFVFAVSAGGTNSAAGVASDAIGNCFVTGGFYGTATFESTSVTSAGQEDIFVAKYDGGGQLLWVTRAGGTNADAGEGIAADAAGNCYVTGQFRGIASFGSEELVGISTNGFSNMFLAKYDASGNLVWVNQAGTPTYGGVDGSGVTADTNGNSYVTGSYAGGPAYFGDTVLTNTGVSGYPDLFVAKYGATGNLVWARQQVLGGYYGYGSGVAIDSHQNVYVIGGLGFGTNPSSLYLAKYDVAGNFLWATVAGSRSGGVGVAVDNFDNVLVTGDFCDTLSSQGVTVTSAGGSDGLLAKFSPGGTLLWLRQMGGTNNDVGYAITTDQSGNSFVGGLFSGSALFGPTNLVGSGAGDAFVAKYDGSGNLVWVVQAGGSESIGAAGVAWEAGKGVFVAGGFTGEAAFGGISLTSGHEVNNMYLTRVDEMPILAVSNSASGVNLSWPTSQLGFTLEKATNSLPAPQWSTVTNRVSVSGDHYVVTDQLSGGGSFYRLRKP